MASCLRPLPLSPIPSTSLTRTNPRLRLSCSASMGGGRRRSSASTGKSRMPLSNPNDPFLQKLAHVAATNPDMLLDDSAASSNSTPFLNIFNSAGDIGSPPPSDEFTPSGRRRSLPPDLPSILFDRRIVYIGLPLVPLVSELLVSELLYLGWHNPKETIYLYIHSTGTTRDDGSPIALESEGFMLYDALMNMRCEIRTLCLGLTMGHAALLLAAGTKGQRCILPYSNITIQQPQMPPTGLVQASDVEIRAKEAISDRNTFVKLLAKHTGNTEEYIMEKIKSKYVMNSVEAQKFGIVDRVLWYNHKDAMEILLPPEEWDEALHKEIDMSVFPEKRSGEQKVASMSSNLRGGLLA